MIFRQPHEQNEIRGIYKRRLREKVHKMDLRSRDIKPISVGMVPVKFVEAMASSTKRNRFRTSCETSNYHKYLVTHWDCGKKLTEMW